MSVYQTTIEDHTGFLHSVEILYTWQEPEAATETDPSSGGVEVLEVICTTKKLTLQEQRRVIEETIAGAWEYHRTGGFSG